MTVRIPSSQANAEHWTLKPAPMANGGRGVQCVILPLQQLAMHPGVAGSVMRAKMSKMVDLLSLLEERLGRRTTRRRMMLIRCQMMLVRCQHHWEMARISTQMRQVLLTRSDPCVRVQQQPRRREAKEECSSEGRGHKKLCLAPSELNIKR